LPKEIELEDKYENMGAQMVKEVPLKPLMLLAMGLRPQQFWQKPSSVKVCGMLQQVPIQCTRNAVLKKQLMPWLTV
jgi:hypothetical protein